MKYCIHCGEKLEDDDLFCPDCGARQGERKILTVEMQDADIARAKEEAKQRAAEEEARKQREEEEKRQRAQYSVMPSARDFNINICEEAAQGGWTPAQRNLGMCYLTGRAVNTDVDEVMRKLCGQVRYDAEQDEFVDDDDADIKTIDDIDDFLGEVLLPGRPMEKDIEKGVLWLRMAAERGDADAQFWLGICYAEGLSGEKDEGGKGIKWLNRGAENGGQYTQLFMAIMFMHKDEDAANMWLTKSSKQGNDAASEVLRCRQKAKYRGYIVRTVVDKYIYRIANGHIVYDSARCIRNKVTMKEGKEIILGYIDITGKANYGLTFTADKMYESSSGRWMEVSYNEIRDDWTVETNKKGAAKRLTLKGCYGGKALKKGEAYILPKYYDLFALRDCLLQIKSALWMFDQGYSFDHCLASIH